MALQIESTSFSDRLSSLEAWIWPMTAAIAVGGALLFSSFVGLFWLAAHPVRQETVIWMQPAASQASPAEQPVALGATIAPENRPDARTN
jgi:hypothetical protein